MALPEDSKVPFDHAREISLHYPEAILYDHTSTSSPPWQWRVAAGNGHRTRVKQNKGERKQCLLDT